MSDRSLAFEGPLAGFPLEVFRDRRARLSAALGDGVLLLPAAALLHRSRGTEHRYRPDSELFYMTGWTEPGALAVLLGEERDDPFVLFVPEREAEEELWNGPRRGPDEAKELLGCDAAFPSAELEDRLPGLLKGARHIYSRLGVHRWLDRLVIRTLSAARASGARTGGGPRSLSDPGQVLDEIRLRKDPFEQERIRAATSLSVASFKEALASVRPGRGEWEVEAMLESAFRLRGASGPAFPTIVGSGPNARFLHYRDNRDEMRGEDLVLVDGGAEVGMYSGDITRTVPVSGRFDPRQRDLYDLVLRAHDVAIASIRPGVRLEEVHKKACRVLTEGLAEVGILDGRLDDLLESQAYRPYFPHNTSHWLGLDLHDVGDYAVAGVSRVLEPGMVLTVEPGLYFPTGEGLPETPFDGMGIRIEDDVLVLDEGVEVLTEDLPVAPQKIEGLLAG